MTKIFKQHISSSARMVAERNMIGGILINKKNEPTALIGFFNKKDFYSKKNLAIYNAIDYQIGNTLNINAQSTYDIFINDFHSKLNHQYLIDELTDIVSDAKRHFKSSDTNDINKFIVDNAQTMRIASIQQSCQQLMTLYDSNKAGQYFPF